MTPNACRWRLAAVCTAALLADCASTAGPGRPPSPHAATDQRPAQFAPQRAPSKTMEVWIAAWEDARGDLHAPSTVYVEVDPARWIDGDGSDVRRATVLRPLQVEERPPLSDRSGNGAADPADRISVPPTAGRRGA